MPARLKSGAGEIKTGDALVAVHAEFLGVGTQTFFLNGFEGAGTNAQLDKPVALGPPKPALLQVHLLELLGAHMGVGYGHAVVGSLASELTDAGHDIYLNWDNPIKRVPVKWPCLPKKRLIQVMFRPVDGLRCSSPFLARKVG